MPTSNRLMLRERQRSTAKHVGVCGLPAGFSCSGEPRVIWDGRCGSFPFQTDRQAGRQTDGPRTRWSLDSFRFLRFIGFLPLPSLGSRRLRTALGGIEGPFYSMEMNGGCTQPYHIWVFRIRFIGIESAPAPVVITSSYTTHQLFRLKEQHVDAARNPSHCINPQANSIVGPNHFAAPLLRREVIAVGRPQQRQFFFEM